MSTCPNCPKAEVEYDIASGTSICTNCGNVCSQNAIVSEVTFGENSAGAAILQGTFVEAGRTRATTTGSSRVRMYSDSRDVTLMNANRVAREIASSLDINEYTIERALRFFKIALSQHFTRGRKTQVTIAACLYTACRDQKSPHMLIDFADAIQISVFAIGNTFLKLSQLFPSDKIPLVDPSLYISRFASKLGFGNRTGRVVTDAARLVSRMKADWIEYGRRPAGICGACLLIAARMNHFQRSLKDIILVVKMSPETIRKRLIEFASTASGNLTVGDFRLTWLEDKENPPSFATNQAENTDIELEQLEHATAAQIKEFYESRKELLHKEVLDATQAYQESLKDMEEFDPTLKDLQEDSQIEDELDQFILSDHEVETKTKMWTEENQDYLDAQEKKRRAKEIEEKNEAAKRTRKAHRKLGNIDASNPAEATLQLLNHKNIANINEPGIHGLFQIPNIPSFPNHENDF